MRGLMTEPRSSTLLIKIHHPGDSLMVILFVLFPPEKTLAPSIAVML